MSESNMKVTNEKGGGPATSLIIGDQISVNLVATKPDGTRMSAAGLFNHMGEAVSLDGKSIPGVPGLRIELMGSATAQPEFPAKKYQELVEQGSIEAAEDLKSAFELELSGWEDKGNVPLTDAIANLALEWAERTTGAKTTDGDHPVIKPEQVVVKSVIRENAQQPGVFIVQLTPAWG